MRTERRERRGEARLPAALATSSPSPCTPCCPRTCWSAPVVIPVLECCCWSRCRGQPPAADPPDAVVAGRVARAGRAHRRWRNTRVAGHAAARPPGTSTRQDGRALLLAALQVWLTNIIVFGLAFWELDRGGPVARTRRPGRAARRRTSGSPRTRTTTRSPRSPRLEQGRAGCRPSRLPLRVADQLHRVQPDRHDAAHRAGEAAHGRGGDQRPGHLRAGHLRAASASSARDPAGRQADAPL